MPPPPPSATTIRLATASPGTQRTTAATLAQLASLARRAAASGADLLLLPEAYIGGYPRGTAFGCVIGDRSAAGRDEFARYWDSAVDLGDTVDKGAGAGQRWVKRQLGGQEGEDEGGQVRRGDGTREELERIAAETGVFLVVGLIEKAGGSLYCAAVYVCPKQGMVGKRRKVMPTATERLVWAQGSPATLRAVSTTIRGIRLNLAAAICWESYMPLLRQALYAQNINLYLAPTADGRDAWLGLMRTIGVEGRCFVVSSNMGVRSEDQSQQQQQQDDPRGRRSSTTTADGFEIALPKASSSSARRKPRRKSIIDENGNEIVLCCDEDGADDALSPSSTRRKPRRKSIIDENGNEIVLCCDADDDDGTNANTNTNSAHAASAAAAAAAVNGEPKPASWVSRGGSCIVSPFGDVLAGPQWEDDESIIYADVDMRDCIRGRLDLDTAGSYSRNDAFHFSVEGLDLDPLPY
jgi:nitrilase